MKYRKPDQFYIDRHDQITIKCCKEKYEEHLSKLLIQAGDNHFRRDAAENTVEYFVKFQYCLCFWREKTITIKKWIQDDERKDNLVEAFVPPAGLKCRTCSETITSSDHFFDQNEELVLIMSCRQLEHPRVFIYSNGDSVIKEKPKCPDCGSNLNTKTEKGKDRFTFNTACTQCSYVETETFELPVELPPIDEDERTRYCFTDEYGAKVEVDFERIKELAGLAQEIQMENQHPGLWEVINQIQKLTISQVESLIAKELHSKGFVKLNFESPQLDRHIIVPFTIQDAQSREQRKSVLKVAKALKEVLLLTNWRLIDPQNSLEHRLGIISGRLKAFETDEDIQKLASQILKTRAQSVT